MECTIIKNVKTYFEYIDEELDGTLYAAMDAHLEKCAGCAATVALLRKIISMYRQLAGGPAARQADGAQSPVHDVIYFCDKDKILSAGQKAEISEYLEKHYETGSAAPSVAAEKDFESVDIDPEELDRETDLYATIQKELGDKKHK